MRIAHCCLAAFYIDDAGYQENILPKMHKLQSHDVTILASTETYIDNKCVGYVSPGRYVNRDGIPVVRVPYARFIPSKVVRKLRIYRGVYRELCEFRPDVIFLHDCQFLDIYQIIRYLKRFPEAKVFVDGHTDLVNSARSWGSRVILHGVIYKRCAKAIERWATKFYGVLPARVEFFEKVYGISPSKTDLLVLGADDTLIKWTEQAEIRARIREAHGIDSSDFLIVTGGKLDKRKNIHNLIRALDALQRDDIKLIVFGVPSRDMESVFEQILHYRCVRYLGWVDANSVYDYFLAADLGVFPGTHSVLWEQAVGTGLPCVFMRWEGMQHIDLGGNCRFIDQGTTEEICEKLPMWIDDREGLEKMRQVAMTRGVTYFSYSEIARRAIGLN